MLSFLDQTDLELKGKSSFSQNSKDGNNSEPNSLSFALDSQEEGISEEHSVAGKLDLSVTELNSDENQPPSAGI